MNFRPRAKEEPEINLIPFIDVLLVVLIFLMLTTTYSKFTELQITLPTAEADKVAEKPFEINVTVDAKGNYPVNNTPVAFTRLPTLSIDRPMRPASASTVAMAISEVPPEQPSAWGEAVTAMRSTAAGCGPGSGAWRSTGRRPTASGPVGGRRPGVMPLERRIGGEERTGERRQEGGCAEEGER